MILLLLLLAIAVRSAQVFNLSPVSAAGKLADGSNSTVSNKLSWKSEIAPNSDGYWRVNAEKQLCGLSYDANLHANATLGQSMSGSQLISVVINMTHGFDGFYIRANGMFGVKVRNNGFDVFVFLANWDEFYHVTGTPSAKAVATKGYPALTGAFRVDIAMHWTSYSPNNAHVAVTINRLSSQSTTTSTTTTTTRQPTTPLPTAAPFFVYNHTISNPGTTATTQRLFAILGQYNSNFCILNWTIHDNNLRSTTTTPRPLETSTTTTTTTTPITTTTTTTTAVQPTTSSISTTSVMTATARTSTIISNTLPASFIFAEPVDDSATKGSPDEKPTSATQEQETQEQSTSESSTDTSIAASARTEAVEIVDRSPVADNQLPLILGLVFGIALVCTLLTITVLVVRRHRREVVPSATETPRPVSSPNPTMRSDIYGNSSFTSLR